MFLEISQNSQENTCAIVSFLIKELPVAASDYNYLSGYFIPTLWHGMANKTKFWLKYADLPKCIKGKHLLVEAEKVQVN